MACMAELETAIASAPRAIAFMKSAGLRRPPVMTRVMSLRSSWSRCRRARASAGMVGTEMLSRNMIGAAPVPPPRPSRMI